AISRFCSPTRCLELESASHRSRGLAALTSSPRRSSASALSGSALRIAFARYALSAKAGRRAYFQAIIRLITKLRVE
ncbi:hypothetical protein CJI55_01955, partial [Gardnerella vaginalis]